MVLRVLVTGAAGQIGYAVVMQIAKGDVFGPETPVILVLFDIPPMLQALEGVQFELQDCALPTLQEVVITVKEEEAFKDVDYAFLIGAMPRKQGMERKDLLSANVKIFKSQGMAFAKYAKPTTKASPTVPEKNFTSMTRLDHNRAISQVAMKCGVGIRDVKNVIIWGNHSSTQFPDVTHAKVAKNGSLLGAYDAINDQEWIRGPFISVVQKRGAVIIEKRKLSSAMSAAKAACDHIHDWHCGTKPGEWVSMGIPSDGSYGIPKGLMFSFPVTISGGEYKIVQGLSLDDFAKEKIAITQKELEEERDEALEACA
uniref:Malate dehydrogenase n=1 Tax=Setaria digitata TaxID=48799 RepID=A0A915Q1N6_9BILA